jgi:hypothetical protein
LIYTHLQAQLPPHVAVAGGVSAVGMDVDETATGFEGLQLSEPHASPSIRFADTPSSSFSRSVVRACVH